MDKTQEIFQLTCPYNNPYQGNDPRVLFVCSAGLLRSATAANHFAKKGWNTRSCGSEAYALIPLSVNLITWAERIYFMKKVNLLAAKLTFKDNPAIIEFLEDKDHTYVLDIPDHFEYGNPELIKLLDERVKE